MTSFLDTKTLYPSNSVTKEFWEKFKTSFKVYNPPEKEKKALRVTSKSVSNSSFNSQAYGSFRITTEENAQDSDNHDRLMQVNLETLQSWSPDNLELYKKLMELGYKEELINKNFLVKYYKELKLEELKIERIDKETTLFTSLEIISLSRNLIQILENLPPNIKEVTAFYNQISYVQNSKPYENLLYLGLGYNRLTDVFLEQVPRIFPKLMSLDVSYNDICNLESTFSALTTTKNLRMLNLYGNPVALFPHYRSSILEELKMLKVFDNEKVNQEVSYKVKALKPEDQGLAQIKEALAKEQAGKGKEPPAKETAKGKDAPKDQGKGKEPAKELPKESSRGGETLRNSELPDLVFRSNVLDNIPEGNQLRFTVSVFTLEEVTGVNFNDQFNPTGEAPSENYQTSFWISCQIMDSYYETKTQKILFDSCTVENESARLDFECSMSMDISITPETRDFFTEGLIIKIHKKEPILEQAEPDAEKKPLLKDGQLQLEEKILGVCKLDLRTFIEPKSDGKPGITQKFRLWPEKFLEIPEFNYPVNNEALKIKKILEKQIKVEEVKQPEPVVVDPKKGGKGKDAGKKETKKDTKKDTKKGGKGKAEPVEKKVVALLDWPLNSREKVLGEGEKILDCIPSYLLAIKAEVTLED